MKSTKNQRENEKGVYYGYIVAAISFLIITLIYGMMYSYGVFFEPLRTDFGWSSTETSGAYSLYMVLHGLFFIITGRITDKYGPRFVMTVSGLFLGVGYLLMSQIEAIWQLYLIYGFIIAIGSSGGYVPLISTVSRWFVKRRGLITGICVAGVGVGTMIIPPIANWLIYNYSWRTSFIVIGMTSLIFIVLGSQFLKSDPAESGRKIDRIIQVNTDFSGDGFSFRQVISMLQFWLLCLLFFCFGLYIQTILVHIIPYIRQIEPSLGNPTTIMTTIGALSIAGRVLMGAISDKISNRTVAIVCFAFMFCAACLLMIVKGIWSLYFFGVIFGFAYGGLAAAQSPLIADLFGLVSHGSIFGVITFVATIGGGIGPSFAGYMFDLTGSYFIPFLVLTIISIIGLIFTLLLKPTHYQKLNRYH